MTVQTLALARLLDHQSGVVGRAQLVAIGLHDSLVTRRIRRGDWQRLLPGVISTGRDPASPEQRRIAAGLYAGPDGQLTGPAALTWYGFRRVPVDDRVHVLVPHEIRRRSYGFAMMMRTTTLDPAPRDAGPYRLASPTRACADACRTLNPSAVRAILGEAATRGDVGLDTLAAELGRTRHRGTALANQIVADLAAGQVRGTDPALSSAIEEFPTVLWGPGLVGPAGEPLPTPQAYLPDTAIAIEVDDGGGHDLAREVERLDALNRAGILVLRFTRDELTSHPDRVRTVVGQAHDRRRARPLPALPVATDARSPARPPVWRQRAALTVVR